MARIKENSYYEKRYKDMTIKELKAQIRYKTNQVNIALYDKPELHDKFAVQQTVKKLQATGAKGRNGNVVGLGFTKGRDKESYIRQLRELEYAEPLISDYEGVAFMEEKFTKAMNTFLSKKGNQGKTEEDWRDMVETFGTLGKEIVDQFGSNQVAELFKSSTRNVDMVQLMLDTLDEAEGKGWNKRELKSRLKKKISEQIGKF